MNPPVIEIGQMKILGLPIASLILVHLMSFAEATYFPRKGGLLQVDLTEFARYRAIRLSKLGPTRFDCGRMIVEPAFAPEYSVSVYSRQKEGKQRVYFATYVLAGSSLWQNSEIGRYPQRAEAIRVHRIDAKVPKRTAKLLKEAWLQMLSGAQRPRSIREEDVRSTDSTVAEFSIETSAGKSLQGEVLDIASPPGQKAKALLELANSLIDYCKTEPAKRPSLVSELDRKATSLLALLKQAE